LLIISHFWLNKLFQVYHSLVKVVKASFFKYLLSPFLQIIKLHWLTLSVWQGNLVALLVNAFHLSSDVMEFRIVKTVLMRRTATSLKLTVKTTEKSLSLIREMIRGQMFGSTSECFLLAVLMKLI
jgi:hypothetical protein